MTTTRVVKPRSAKQRAHARNAFKDSSVHYAPPPIAPPASTSWWTNVSREELRARAERERARISLSRFGRLVGTGLLPE
jgi:hypothetical protein